MVIDYTLRPDLQLKEWRPGDRVVLARLSVSQDFYGISEDDYGKAGTVVSFRDDISVHCVNKYAVLLDKGARSKTCPRGCLYTWNITADQLDAEEGPW